MNGRNDPRFARLRDAFAASFASGSEHGAALAVTLDGRPVVDLWDGFTDKAKTRPWAADTIVNVYSVTKAWTAVSALRLVDQGKLDLDRAVADYWPEFARADKGAIRVRALLDHQAGLPAIRALLPREAVFDWDRVTSALADETPWWTPGTRHGYHAVTFGWLVGELVRRVAGKTVGACFREEIAGPLGLDAYIGVAEADDARCSELRFLKREPNAPPALLERLLLAPESMAGRAFTNPFIFPSMVATREWRSAELPSLNGHGNARASARLFGALAGAGEVDGVRILSPETIVRARTEHSHGADPVLGVSTRFGLGFMLTQPGEAFGPNDGAFGHTGMGGSVGFADPEARLGFGYVTNMLGSSILLDPRARVLIDAVYDCL